MLNITYVRNLIKELDEMTGLSGADLPLKVTKTQKTLASFVYTTFRRGQIVTDRVPTRFEFSRLALSCDEETLKEIVKHEYAHYMALVTYRDKCGHDYRFKKMCKQIGASANEPTFSSNSIEEQSLKLAKYVVTCEGCGQVYTYNRMCPTLRACKEGKAECPCGCKNFTVKQNH